MSDGFGVVPNTSGGTAAAGNTGQGADDAGDGVDAGEGGAGGRDLDSGGTTALGSGGTVASTGGCQFTKFSAPEKLGGLGSTSEQWSPTLSADSLALYFSIWDTSERLYVATRADRGRYFSTSTRLTVLGAVFGPPASPFVNGLELYFLVSGSSSTDRDIWVASRETTSSTTFSGAEYLHGVNSTSAEDTPWLSRDGSTLLFSSARPNGVGDMDIWKSTRESSEFSARNCSPG